MTTPPLLLIFVKYPEPGKVKTRLAKVLGDEGAAQAYRRLVAEVASRVLPREDRGEAWTIWVVFDPEEREAEIREWLEPLFGSVAERYLAQRAGDLGARLEGAFADGFAAGFGRVAAIGTDCVDLDATGIGECWRILGEKDVVFGPADDGGYYLVGTTKECPELFDAVPWSEARTLEVSKAKAAAAGLSVGELAVLSDVDVIGQWEAVEGRV